MSQDLTFNFDDLTIGDLVELLRAVTNNDTAKIVDIADRTIVGGVKHMSLKVFHATLRQFGSSFAVYMQQLAEASPAALWIAAVAAALLISR